MAYTEDGLLAQVSTDGQTTRYFYDEAAQMRGAQGPDTGELVDLRSGRAPHTRHTKWDHVGGGVQRCWAADQRRLEERADDLQLRPFR